MKLFIFTTLLLILCTHLSLCQINKSKTVEKFEQNADTLFKTFKYDSASVYYCKAARLYETKQDWLYCAKNYRLTSNALLKASKADSALNYSNRALNIAETKFQENNIDEMFEKLNILLQMANVNEKKGKFKEELNNCKKALELTLKTDSLDSLRIAAIWYKTGVAYSKLGNYTNALQLCDSALSVRLKLLGEDCIEVAECNATIGRIYLNKGEYNKAIEYSQKALKTRIVTLGELYPDVADSYNNIGIIYYQQGKYDWALEYYQKALKIRIATVGGQHPDVAVSYNNIGGIYGIKGEYDKALASAQKALKIQMAVFGEQHPYVADDYNNMGLIYNVKGEYDKALDYYQKSLKIDIAIFGEKHAYIADCYSNMGKAYDNQRKYDKALEYYQKALKINIATLGEQHPFLAFCYTNIGEVYNTKREYDKALEYYQIALKIRLATLGEQHPVLAVCYNNIGAVCSNQGEYDKALAYYQKAIKIRIAAFGEQHPLLALCYNNIGENNSNKTEYSKAVRSYQKAIIANVVGFNDSAVYSNPKLNDVLSKPILLHSLIGKADALYELFRDQTKRCSDLETSLSTYELAFQLVNDMRNECNIENTKLLLSEETKNDYIKATKVAMEFSQVIPTKKNYQRVFEFIEKGKNATMTARLNEHNAQHFAAIPDSLIIEEKTLHTKMGFNSTQILNKKYQKDGYDTLKVNALENENFTCSRKLDSLISYFETTYPAYYELKYANKIDSISEIQKSLDNNTAILDYFVGDSSLFIATITDRLYKIEEIPIESSFKKQITSYYSNIKKVETQLFVSNSIFIYEKLIKPIRNYISGKKHLVIIPDDYLYYLPFETLIENAASPKATVEDYSKLNYLIKNHSISYHHSASLWNHQKKIEGDHTINFMGFAPVFSKENNNGVILSSNVNTMDSTGNNLAYRSISADMKRFNPLPYSKYEVTSIVHLFEKKKKEAKAYIYSEASEANFKSNSENYSIVHVSSHGFSNDKEPGLSGIVFSQPTDTLDKEDGILYTSETYNLSLHADLIVLSSCESGLGKLIKGEGLQALSRGFLYAGTPNIIFSLWKAMDKPTKDLMVQFYSNVLDGTSYDESLRLAKLKLINDPKTAFPLYWSGFVLIGK